MTTQLEAQQDSHPEASSKKIFQFPFSALSDLRKIPFEKLLIAGILIYWAIGLIMIVSSDDSISLGDPIIFYFPPAQQFLEGQGINAFAADMYHGPGYPILLAFITLVTGNMLLSSKLIAMTSALLYVFLAYLIARRMFSSTTAIVSMLLLLNINTFLWISTSPGTDMPFSVLAMLSYYLMIRSETPTRLEMVLAGVAAGIALTFRWTGQVLPIILAIRLLLLLRNDKATLIRVGSLFATYLVAFVICAGPWLYINSRLHGEMFFNYNGYNLDPSIFTPGAPSLFDALQITIAESSLSEVIGRFISNRISVFPAYVVGFNEYPAPHGWVMAGAFWAIIVAGALLTLIRLTRLRAWLLLSLVVVWLMLNLAHYEARSYVAVFFGITVLIAAVFSEGFLPDLRLVLRPALGVRFDAGIFKSLLSQNTLSRLGLEKPFVQSLRSRAAAAQAHHQEQAGISLIAVVFGAALFLSTFSAFQNTDEGHEWFTYLHDIYRDVSTYVNSENNGAVLKPIAVRQWSPARYWIPNEAKVPAVQYPTEDYRLVLSEASYLLFDQYNGSTELISRLDDPQLEEIRNPAQSPYNLEAVIYRQSPWVDVLYRILDDSHEAVISTAKASAGTENTEVANIYDGDTSTFWSAPVNFENGEPLSISYELDVVEEINRVWLLPAADRNSFPGTVSLEVSEDNENWQAVVTDESLPTPAYQNPHVFTFAPVSARFLRLTMSGASTAEGDASEISLAEIRIGRGTERARSVSSFSLEAQDLGEASEASELFVYEPDAALVAGVFNQGESAGQADVSFYSGASLDSATLIGTGQSPIIAPGEFSFAKVDLGDVVQFAPGECHPIWAVLEPPQYSSSLPLDTFGMNREAEPVSYFRDVCLSNTLSLGFYPLVYASTPAWTVPEDQTSEDQVRVVRYDPDVSGSVMEVFGTAETGQSVIFPVQSSSYEDLSMQMKTASDFIIAIDVSDQTGQHYSIQYTTREDLEPTDENTVVYQLTSSFLDDTWRQFDIKLYDDVSTAIKRKNVTVESIAFQTWDTLALTDLKLTSTK